MSIVKSLAAAALMTASCAVLAANPWVADPNAPQSAPAAAKQQQKAAPAKARAPYVGHYKGMLLDSKGKPAEGEISIDPYKCYVLSVMTDHGVETGFVDVKDGRIEMRHPNTKEVNRVFQIDPKDGSIVLTENNGDKVAESKDCCRLTRR